jgi:hypothetical protein
MHLYRPGHSPRSRWSLATNTVRSEPGAGERNKSLPPSHRYNQSLVAITFTAQPSWWSSARILAGTDDINETIWNGSPRIHARQGFTTKDLSELWSLGAQQAMLDSSLSPELGKPSPVLPWVPDLLGQDWTHECGIVIASAVTPNPAICGHFKTGQRGHSGTDPF